MNDTNLKTQQTEPLLFGAIADDYTGASDLASRLNEQQVRAIQIFGLQPDEFIEGLRGRYEAVIVSLKSRSIAKVTACEWSLRALDQLVKLGTRQAQFKYCSTFDSTAEGNIGPVTEALMEALPSDFTIAVPALPGNGRTQYNGYLFVGSQLLSESQMRHHPLNPMTEPNLVRHLQAQTTKKVGLIPHASVRAGAARIQLEAEMLKKQGVAIALVDATDEDDLAEIAEAFVQAPLITGGSGLAIKLPAVWRRKKLLADPVPGRFSEANKSARALILSGSCSAATLEQLRTLRESGHPVFRLDLSALMLGHAEAEVERLVDEISRAINRSSCAAVYSSASAGERAAAMCGFEAAGITADVVATGIESALGEIARRAVEESGIQKLIVAGGETSGAVVDALEIQAVEIRDTVEAGVPAMQTIGNRDLTLVLKSGNFGGSDFFLRALS